MEQEGELQELASKAAQGDLQAAERLFQALHGPLVSLLYLLGIPDAEIDDVAQQTAVEVYKSLSHFAPDRPFLPWMRTIARHMASHFWRTRARQEVRNDRFRQFVQMRVEEDEQAVQRAVVPDERLRTCLEKLPEQHRAILGWRYQEGLDAPTIADRLRTSATAVRKLLSRVRESLRTCLKTWPTESPRGRVGANHEPSGIRRPSRKVF